MASEYRLIDNHIIAAMVHDESTGKLRESTLDLDYCISRDYWGGDHSYWVAARAPKSFTRPYLDHTTAIRWKLSESYAQKNLSVTLNGRKLHIREEIYIPIFPNEIVDSDINLNNYIRRTKTGHLEWMHP